MLLRHILRIFVIMLSPAALLAQATPFQQALADGKILVTVKSQGGHTGQCISVHFERLTEKPIRIRIPAGHIFECSDSLLQNIIVVKSEEFALNAKKQFIRVQGMCSEAGNGSPIKDVAYQIGKMAEGNLLKMAEFISDKKLWSESDAQLAIWCMTDGYQPAGLSHPALQTTACQLLGVARPEYKINYPKPASTPAPARTAARPRPVMEKKPLSVEGVFNYETQEDTEISVLVKNEAGDTVKTIFDREKQPIGTAKYTFYFKTTKLPPGNYEVILYDKERAVKKIKVKY